MPYLRRLVNEGSLSLLQWRCGLPSATPAVQAGILFGSRYDIPGFRWYEKEWGMSVVAKRPDQMRALQARLKGPAPGLLAGGSSYVNLFDADADLALFTLSALHPQRFFESMRGLGLLMLFLLSPLRMLRVFGLTVKGYFAALWWRLVALFRPSVLKLYDVINPLVVSAADALMTEVQTFGVMVDIYRRVPAIYTNYNHYDEVAHHMGPMHPAALSVLGAVDRRIHQIDRMRMRYRSRPYDLYILSDHGNTPSIPFSWEVGRSLGRFIIHRLGEQLSLDEVFGRPGYSLAKARYLLEDLRAASERLPAGLQRVVRALWRYVDRKVPPDREVQAYDLRRREDVVVRASGPLAHVYFNVARRPLDLIEVALLYPHLLDRLLATEAVGLVAGRADEDVVALGPQGGTVMISGGISHVEGPNPLARFGEPGWVARELQRVVNFPHAGDLTLLGGVDSDGIVVTFEEQVATHGGLGGAQGRPFIAGPSQVELPTADGPEELYHFFRERYGRGEQTFPGNRSKSEAKNAL